MSGNKRYAVVGEEQPNNTGTEGPTASKVATATLTATLHGDEESVEENDDDDSRLFKKAKAGPFLSRNRPDITAVLWSSLH